MESLEEVTDEAEVSEAEVSSEIEQTEQTADEEKSEEKRPKQTAQERINEITRKFREAERRELDARREAEYWKTTAEGKTEAASDATDGRPRIDNYDTAEQYEDALFDWYESKRSAKEIRRAEEEAIRRFNKAAEKFRKDNPDFDVVVNTPVFTDTMRKVLLNGGEKGVELGYYLGSNRHIAEEIASHPPEIQTYMLGKLEATRNSIKKKASGAPDPIRPLEGSGEGREDPEKMSIEEWIRKENEKMYRDKYG